MPGNFGDSLRCPECNSTMVQSKIGEHVGAVAGGATGAGVAWYLFEEAKDDIGAIPAAVVAVSAGLCSALFGGFMVGSRVGSCAGKAVDHELNTWCCPNCKSVLKNP